MLADGNGDYAKALGLEMDGSGFGMGMRGQRFALVVKDGVVEGACSSKRRASSRSPPPTTSSPISDQRPDRRPICGWRR